MTSAMPPTRTRRKAAADGAASQEKDFVTRLTDAGEEALQRLSELPGGQKALTAFNDLRARVDDLGKKVRGIDALEARVVRVEKEIAALRKSSSPARRSTTRKPSS